MRFFFLQEGERVGIIGSHDALGSWSLSQALPLLPLHASYTSLTRLLHAPYTPLTRFLHASYTLLTRLLQASYTPLTRFLHAWVLSQALLLLPAFNIQEKKRVSCSKAVVKQ